MANARPQRKKYTSPKGVFRYPKLTVPDTKFKEEGEYSVSLRLFSDNPEAIALMKLCDKEAGESLAEAKSKAKNAAEAKKWETKFLPYKVVEDDDGEETGEVDFKFTMKASGVAKATGRAWNMKPALFAASGAPITGDINIGGGSVGRISFEIIQYAPTTVVGASAKLAMTGAQIIELKSFGERSASEYGFGAEEGYSQDEFSAGASSTGSAGSDGEGSTEVDDEIPF